MARSCTDEAAVLARQMRQPLGLQRRWDIEECWPQHYDGSCSLLPLRRSLHLAAQRGHVATIQALLRVAPKAALSPDMNGWLPVRCCFRGSAAAAVHASLAAATIRLLRELQ